MSQIYKPATASVGPIPPTVIVEVDTQDGNATTANSILIMNGESSSENNDNAIITKGGVAGTGTQNEVDIVLTNRTTDQVNTSDATLTTIITFPLGSTPACFYVFGNIQAFASSLPGAAAYSYTGGYRTNGTTATELGTEYHDTFQSANMVATDIFLSASGNNVLVQVQGIAATSIDWNAILEFRQVT